MSKAKEGKAIYKSADRIIRLMYFSGYDSKTVCCCIQKLLDMLKGGDMSEIKEALLDLRDVCANALVNLETLKVPPAVERKFVLKVTRAEFVIRQYIKLLFTLNNKT